MSSLYVAWQDPETRRWSPVARLTKADGKYVLRYTAGSLISSRFVPFSRMRDLYQQYESTSLFPLFANRLLPKSRPEYNDYMAWMGLPSGSDDMEILARSLGIRATDSIQVIPSPDRTGDGRFNLTFFAHGLGHLPASTLQRLEALEPGAQLYAMLDVMNPHDANAVSLRTDDPACLAGYVPRFLARDLREVVSRSQAGNALLRVERFNQSAPSQMKLLCHFSAPWPEGFQAYADEEYALLPLQSDGAAAVSGA